MAAWITANDMQIDTTLQQLKDLITGGSVQKILVTSGANVDPDALGSALALAEGLESMGKSVTVAIEGFEQGRYRYLPGIERVSDVVGQKSLVVSIDVGQNPIEKINYNAEATTFNLILTPKTGQVNVDQIKYSYAGLTYDLIMVVDTARASLLGRWVEDFAEELKVIPMVNIDHHADNEQFGTLNYIQPKQPAAAGVLEEVFNVLEIPITPTMATNLLAGIISDTGGFNNSNADALSLRMSADLVDAGADLNAVMRGTFRDLSVPALHLWSRALESVELVDPGIVIAQISQADVLNSAATQADQDSLDQVVNGLVPAVSAGRVAVMLKEKDNGEVRGSLRSIDPTVNVQAIAANLGGGGHVKASGFSIKDTTLDRAREQVLEAIRSGLASQMLQPQVSAISENGANGAPERQENQA